MLEEPNLVQMIDAREAKLSDYSGGSWCEMWIALLDPSQSVSSFQGMFLRTHNEDYSGAVCMCFGRFFSSLNLFNLCWIFSLDQVTAHLTE